VPPLLPQFERRADWDESASRRLWRELYERLKTPWFWVGATVLGAFAGAVAYLVNDETGLARVLLTSGAAVFGMIAMAGLVLLVLALRVPIWQRDDARAARDEMARHLAPAERLSFEDEVRPALSLRRDEGAALLGRAPAGQLALFELQAYLPQWNQKFATGSGVPQYPDMLESLSPEALHDWLSRKLATLDDMVDRREVI
jgi:hypothetical protein